MDWPLTEFVQPIREVSPRQIRSARRPRFGPTTSRVRNAGVVAAAVTAMAILSVGCGKKGPLYHPAPPAKSAAPAEKETPADKDKQKQNKTSLSPNAIIKYV